MYKHQKFIGAILDYYYKNIWNSDKLYELRRYVILSIILDFQTRRNIVNMLNITIMYLCEQKGEKY